MVRDLARERDQPVEATFVATETSEAADGVAGTSNEARLT
jgi:hypothetical protein